MRRRWVREEVPEIGSIVFALFQVKDTYLTFKSKYGSIDIDLAQFYTGVIH
jgi:hypothetical protein